MILRNETNLIQRGVIKDPALRSQRYIAVCRAGNVDMRGASPSRDRPRILVTAADLPMDAKLVAALAATVAATSTEATATVISRFLCAAAKMPIELGAAESSIRRPGDNQLAWRGRKFWDDIAHQALIAGHTVLFTSAGQLLGDLCALDSDSALRRRLRHYVRPQLLVIDEVGYLSYSNRHADLMFELVSRRYQNRSTLITTNRPFAEWREVFPDAACVVSLIDRLVHNTEIVAIEGESYRLKEARERAEQRSRQRRGAKTEASP